MLTRMAMRWSPESVVLNRVADLIFGGGRLAAELTQVFSRMGKVGVQAILDQAPFPVLQAA